MDMIKIGKFLAELRREQNLTQEQLGEQLGVTNKTVSRWETGNYLPPVEILMMLSTRYDVSVNEIISGERLTKEAYVEKAEENLQAALKESAFSVQEKTAYFSKKWQKDHLFETILGIVLLTALFLVGHFIARLAGLQIAAFVLAFVFVLWQNNRKAAYIENHIYQ